MITADIHSRPLDHAGDVLSDALEQMRGGARIALAVLIDSSASAVRDLGALMAINETGDISGYLSGGCIDADVSLRAREAIKTNQSLSLLYGAGSPFVDIQLPCGGSLQVLICPNPDRETLQATHTQLANRQPVTLGFHANGVLELDPSNPDTCTLTKRYEPKLRLRIAGRGADFIAMARLASVSGFACHAQSPNEADLRALSDLPHCHIQRLVTPGTPPNANDDPWTAFGLMFHDRDWEHALLRQALLGDAFYIGAVGSRKTHAHCCERLHANGIAQSQIERIHRPIGLVPALRDASMLAVSALAEIVQNFHARQPA